MSKRLLLVYSNNFYQTGMGTNTRVKSLAKCFKELGYDIDYFSFSHFSDTSHFDNFEEENKDGLIKNLYLHDFWGTEEKLTFFQRAIRKLKRIFHIKEYKDSGFLGNWIQPQCQKLFDEVTQKNDYDVIVLFYTYMATLLKGKELRAKKIYFMEDSMFLQQYSWDKDKNTGVTLGKLMDEELERMKVFDDIFCISNDEKIMYGKLLGKDIYFLPHLIEKTSRISQIPLDERKWDIYFIGFNNPFNAEGLEWFLKEVYPLLGKEIKIVLVGSVTKAVEIPNADNIEVIPFAESLDDIYDNSKICICPMFQGTGMKIKVVEAMAKGIPVVCNERGVDGLPDKSMSGCLVTQEPECFASYIHKLLSDQEYYSAVSGQTKEYYSKVFDRQDALRKIKKVFDR